MKGGVVKFPGCWEEEEADKSDGQATPLERTGEKDRGGRRVEWVETDF